MSEHNQKLIAEYLNGTLDEVGKTKVEAMIAKGDIDFIDFRAMEQLHDELEMIPIPEPSNQMSRNFYAMLEMEKEATKTSLWKVAEKRLIEFFNYLTLPRFAYACLLLIAGGIVGSQLNSQDSEIEQLTSEMQNMREVMMVSMLEGPSTTDRLKAVNISAELPMADEKAIRALLFTLNNDESVNVRVQTVEALTRWGKNETVREGFVRSIANQDSEIVIVALADAMVDIGLKKSTSEFQKLINETDMSLLTKQKVENTIAILL